mmetsp:Transcript_60425/g.148279  ORF Transcript_60425/g.148279 Transcript_60425/m.148279 type:complete len:109 (-) Transcript_60425:727-1053(-)
MYIYQVIHNSQLLVLERYFYSLSPGKLRTLFYNSFHHHRRTRIGTFAHTVPEHTTSNECQCFLLHLILPCRRFYVCLLTIRSISVCLRRFDSSRKSISDFAFLTTSST